MACWGFVDFLVITIDLTVLQTVQMPGVYSAAYGTLYYKEPLKSFEILRDSFCRDIAQKAIFTHSP